MVTSVDEVRLFKHSLTTLDIKSRRKSTSLSDLKTEADDVSSFFNKIKHLIKESELTKLSKKLKRIVKLCNPEESPKPASPKDYLYDASPKSPSTSKAEDEKKKNNKKPAEEEEIWV